ncbi:MBL fold metallo-hydrolase [Paraburkholderia sp. BCC1886]|uniref:MBL fold metallo-hydrolase n=1 Tax=Paraburkholderia sp. BCC1886 TaxID=2562670 RepID=UPI001181DA25|nr:MBL fold metallo-hydrolase [Paraburkholderia sp. BCC1886]
MKIHIAGHASLLFETQGPTVLMDPVFVDPHYERTSVMCPRRDVDWSRLPRFDILVISHRHLDHFDVRTLAKLNRHCTVLIPAEDALVEQTVARLGFDRCRTLASYESVTFGSLTLTATPSKACVKEFGLVLRDSTATVWNAVDTNIDGAMACEITAKLGPFDVLFAPWQPLLEGEVLLNDRTSFPFARYAALLSNVRLVAPRAVVPHACGYKYAGEGAWLNRFVFPATREMFARDVRSMLEETCVVSPQPGDIIESEYGVLHLRAQSSAFVRMIEDDSADTAFDPTGPIAELRDANPRDCSIPAMRATIEMFMDATLLPALARSIEQRRIAWEYRQLGVVYRLDVVFPDGPASWSIDFSRALVIKRSAPLAFGMRARIAASALCDLIEARSSPNYTYSSGLYRFAHRLYATGSKGIHAWTPTSESQVVDPLWLGFDFERLFAAHIDAEVERECGRVASGVETHKARLDPSPR